MSTPQPITERDVVDFLRARADELSRLFSGYANVEVNLLKYSDGEKVHVSWMIGAGQLSTHYRGATFAEAIANAQAKESPAAKLERKLVEAAKVAAEIDALDALIEKEEAEKSEAREQTATAKEAAA